MIIADLFTLINHTESITRNRISLTSISEVTRIHRNKLSAWYNGKEKYVTLTDINKVIEYFSSLLNVNEEIVFNILCKVII